MLLYKVCGHEYHNGRLGLLPGLPLEIVASEHIGPLRQGSPISLRLPDGSTISTIIADYYIRVREELGELVPANPPCIVIAVPEGFVREDIPMGSEIEI